MYIVNKVLFKICYGLAGPLFRPGRPGRYLFLRGHGRHMDPDGGPQTGPLKNKSGRPARPAWRAGPPIPYFIQYLIYYIRNILYICI